MPLSLKVIEHINYIIVCIIIITVPTAFSGHVFAPLKNPLNAVAEGFRKNLKIFFFKHRRITVFMVYFSVRKVVIED